MSAEITRRRFLLAGAAMGIALPGYRFLADAAELAKAPERKFYAILSLGRLGFHASFRESVELASKYDFEGLDPDANYFASLDNDALKRFLDDLRKRNSRFGAAG